MALLISALALAVCAGCDDDDDDDDDVVDAGPDAAVRDAAVPRDGATPRDGTVPDAALPTTFTEAEVATIETAINEAQIAQSQLALERATRSDVRDYAEDVYEEHQEALEELTEIVVDRELPTAPTPLSDELRVRADAALTALRTQVGDAFDQAYLDAQIQQHQAALVLLQTSLIPNVRDEGFRNHLSELFNLMNGHLAAARELREELGGTPGPTEG